MHVRSALGVGRVALFREVSTEGLLLALLGGALGLALARGSVALLARLGPASIPRFNFSRLSAASLATGNQARTERMTIQMNAFR